MRKDHYRREPNGLLFKKGARSPDVSVAGGKKIKGR